VSDRSISRPITRGPRLGPRAGKTLCLSLTLRLVTDIPVAVGAELPATAEDSLRGLLSTMQDGRVLGQSGRYARLVPVVGRLFDGPLMAQFAFGPSWLTLSPTKQQEVTEAFAHYISATDAGRFNSYSGEQLQVIWEQPDGAEVSVHTKIVKTQGDAVKNAGERRSLADLGRIPRCYHQPADDAALGISIDPAARRRRRSDQGAKPRGQPGRPKRGQRVIARHGVTCGKSIAARPRRAHRVAN
jgi:hypothetical protein